jgi:hypothetical protein
MSMLHRSPWIAVAFATLLFVLAPELTVATSAPALAAETDDQAGDKYYDAAVRYVKQRKPAKALEFFEKALPYMKLESDIYYNLVMVAEASYAFEKLMLYGAGFAYLEPEGDDTVEIRRKMKRVASMLKKRKQPVADVAFRVSPKGVEIFVDLVPVTKSGGPSVLLAGGSYTATASLEDFNDWSQPFTATIGATQTVRGKLKKKTYYGLLKITTDPTDGVNVLMDGKKIGVSPVGDMKLQTGRYLLRFEKEGWDYWHRYVEIERDATYELTPKMERTPPGGLTTR